MSNPTDNATVSPIVTDESNEKQVEKVTFIQKAKTFVKTHKKSTIAVGALVGLVGVAAVTGRKESSSPELLEPSDVYVGEVLLLTESDEPLSQES